MQVALRKMSTALGLCCVLGLAACGPEPGQVVTGDIPPPTNSSGLEERLPDTCKLTNYQSFVGQRLAAVTLPTGINQRVVKPGTILTQEYVSSRVNFHVNEDGVIAKVICG